MLLAHSTVQVISGAVCVVIGHWYPEWLTVAVVPLSVSTCLLIAAVALRIRDEHRLLLLSPADTPLCFRCGHPVAAHQRATGCGTVTDHLLCGCLAHSGPVQVTIPLGIDYTTECRCVDPIIHHTARHGLPYHHCPKDKTDPYRTEERL